LTRQGSKSLELVVDNYLFDFSRLRETRFKRLVLEAPQGFVRLLPRIASFLREKLPGAKIVYRLEPAYGLCSISLSLAQGDTGVVHVGHDYYPYPFCGLDGCSYRLPDNVLVVPGLYLGGDVEKLSQRVSSLGVGRVAIGYSAQHSRLAASLAGRLQELGVEVVYVGPLLGCYFAPYLRLRGSVDAYLVVAGGTFHALGLGLSLGSGESVYRVDPYSDSVEAVEGTVRRFLAKRFWAMRAFVGARRVGIVVGLLPGQHRPGLVNALTALLKRHGIEYDLILVEHLSRELLDNLGPNEYDAYVVTSCPRLAVDDLGDYWKPVLAPGEAVAALRGGRDYIFPW